MPLASLHKDKKKIGRAFESELLYRFSFDFNIAFMPYSLTAKHPFLFLQVIVDHGREDIVLVSKSSILHHLDPASHHHLIIEHGGAIHLDVWIGGILIQVNGKLIWLECLQVLAPYGERGFRLAILERYGRRNLEDLVCPIHNDCHVSISLAVSTFHRQVDRRAIGIFFWRKNLVESMSVASH